MKTICTAILIFFVFSYGSAQQAIVLTKQKKNGNEKKKEIKINDNVKVYYLSQERLSMADRQPFTLFKRKTGENYIGLADGKLIEFNKDYFLVQRVVTKDLIQIPVESVFAIGKYNPFKRIGILIVTSLGTVFTIDRFWANQFENGYDSSVLLGSFLVAGPLVLNALDKSLFPTHKIKDSARGYKMEIREK